MQTAANMTIATTNGNTIYTLNRVGENSVEWRATTVDGTVFDSVAIMPKLTLSIRRPTKSARSTRYTLRLVVPLWDETVTPAVSKGQILSEHNLVFPDSHYMYDGAYGELTLDIVEKVLQQSIIHDSISAMTFMR
jgi:hypothetical protein